MLRLLSLTNFTSLVPSLTNFTGLVLKRQTPEPYNNIWYVECDDQLWKGFVFIAYSIPSVYAAGVLYLTLVAIGKACGSDELCLCGARDFVYEYCFLCDDVNNRRVHPSPPDDDEDEDDKPIFVVSNPAPARNINVINVQHTTVTNVNM